MFETAFQATRENAVSLVADSAVLTVLKRLDRLPAEIGQAEHIWNVRLLVQEPPSPLLFEPPNYVYITSGYIWEIEEQVLRTFATNSLRILSTLSLAEHIRCASDSFRQSFEQYAEHIKARTGLRKVYCGYLGSVAWLQLFPSTFIIPRSEPLFPVIYEDQYVVDGGLNLNSLPLWYRKQLHQTADALSQFLSDMDVVDEEYFTSGKTAELFARQICLSDSRKSETVTGKRPASVFVIDRTFDLVSPISHSDNLFDFIYTVLPGSEHDLVQPTIENTFINGSNLDMYPKSVCYNLPTAGKPEIQHSTKFIEGILDSNLKDGLSLIRSYLIDTMQNEGLETTKVPKLLGKVTLNQLSKIVDGILAETPSKTQCPSYQWLLEFASACMQALRDSGNNLWDELQGVEKIILLTSNEITAADIDSKAKLVEQLQSILPLGGSGFSLQNALLLLIFTYSLCGKGMEGSDEETMLHSAVLKCFLTYDHICNEEILPTHQDTPQTQSAIEKRQLRLELEDRAQEFFDLLKAVSRKRTSKLGIGNELYVPLVKQLVLSAIEGRMDEKMIHVSPSHYRFGRLFTGVGRILSSKRPNIATSSVIIVFILGGLTFHEVKELRKLAKDYVKQILIVSTEISTPKTIFFRLYGANNQRI